MFKESKKTASMLEQLGSRQSIINQGDIYNQRMNKKEALRLARFDDGILPDQIWYDTLRSNDDGAYAKVSATNKD